MQILNHEKVRRAICQSTQPLDDAAEGLVQKGAGVEFGSGKLWGLRDPDEGAEEGHESRWIQFEGRQVRHERPNSISVTSGKCSRTRSAVRSVPLVTTITSKGQGQS